MVAYIVSGATGFLGRAFVDYLLKAKDTAVIVVVRNEKKALSIWGNQVRIVNDNEKSISRLKSIIFEAHIGKCIFVNFAWDGTSGDKRGQENIQVENIRMSCKMIRIAKEVGCERFINAGSIMEYEANAIIQEEGSRPDLNLLYSIAKYSADAMMKTIAANIGIDYLNVIISNIYGPGELSGRFLSNLIQSLLKNESVKLTKGVQLYDFIYIDDAMVMIKKVAEKGQVFESYYIGNPEQRPLREYILEAKKILESKSELLFGTIPFTGKEIDYSRMNCDKIASLGIKPMVSFSEGIKRIVGKI